MTLYSSELFFAEKAIFIEGVSERLLLPLFIRQFDKENSKENQKLPLSSQNITIVEAGANSMVFSHFLSFLDIKTLIITDIDTIRLKNNTELKENEKKNKERACAVCDQAENTSNASLKHYFLAPLRPTLEDREKKNEEEKKFQDWFNKLLNGKIDSGNQNIKVTYQLNRTLNSQEYHARSFEDAFIFENQEEIKKYKDKLLGLKNKDEIEKICDGLDQIQGSKQLDYYTLTKKIIENKTGFASSLLYIALTENINWAIPEYIKKGLTWIQI